MNRNGKPEMETVWHKILSLWPLELNQWVSPLNRLTPNDPNQLKNLIFGLRPGLFLSFKKEFILFFLDP